ncbi:Uncharacterized iron-regulated membrane protein; Iron-uptake factor PiuB [Cronobacter turicensis 564]|nr:Uncharacterized iron-regulated membrane protein; Iron-uptake factor PiuB [Cronobacter turicensis 564]
MGILFGLPNQLLLIAFGIALCVAIVLGYRLWWLRRPQGPLVSPAATLSQGWLNLPVVWRVITIAIAALLGLALPVMGVSLAILVVMDHWRWRQGRRKPLAQDAV